MSQAPRDMIVALNAGSSSIKFAAFACPGRGDEPGRLLHGEIEGLGHAPHLLAWRDDGLPLDKLQWAEDGTSVSGFESALRRLFDWLLHQLPEHQVCGVSHRVVHGGARYKRPLCVSPAVLEGLEALIPLAPLHQPHSLAAIHAVATIDAGLPQIACFDTGFHAEQDWVMQAYALPQRLRALGLRGYGFHGLSYEYIASQLPKRLGERGEGRVVAAHLGNGASLCAMRECRSVATSMGFSALDGLVMGTRCGHLDPGVLLYLMNTMGMDGRQIEELLYRESGLLGVSGISGDMRELEASTHPCAEAAITLFLNRFARELGAMAAMLGGLDALVFTAGVGEHSAAIRRRACADAAWLGVQIDEAANALASTQARCISTAGSRVAVWVIPTNEEQVLARQAWGLLRARQA